MFDLGANSRRLLQIFDSAILVAGRPTSPNADRQHVCARVGTVTTLYHVNEFDSTKFGYRARVQKAKARLAAEESGLFPEMSFAHRRQTFVSLSTTSNVLHSATILSYFSAKRQFSLEPNLNFRM